MTLITNLKNEEVEKNGFTFPALGTLNIDEDSSVGFKKDPEFKVGKTKKVGKVEKEKEAEKVKE